jgi:PAS domain S-box-containing protein
VEGNGEALTPAVWKLVDALQDGVALADAEGTIALASTALEQMFGYQHGQLRGSGSCSTARGKPRGSSAATLEAAPGPFSGTSRR